VDLLALAPILKLDEPTQSVQLQEDTFCHQLSPHPRRAGQPGHHVQSDNEKVDANDQAFSQA
jgi:hypothetical protein